MPLWQWWNSSGATIALPDALRGKARRVADRNTEPAAAVIDSQSVRRADHAQSLAGLGERQEGQ